MILNRNEEIKEVVSDLNAILNHYWVHDVDRARTLGIRDRVLRSVRKTNDVEVFKADLDFINDIKLMATIRGICFYCGSELEPKFDANRKTDLQPFSYGSKALHCLCCDRYYPYPEPKP